MAIEYFPPPGPFPPEKAIWVEVILNVCEGEKLKVDGFFEPAAWAAIRRFQQRYSLPDKVGFDNRTLVALTQRALNVIQGSTSTIGGSGVLTAELAVALIQSSLLPIHGVMDERTIAELIRFQSSNFLSRKDGIVDRDTRAAMIAALSGGPSPPVIIPVQFPPPGVKPPDIIPPGDKFKPPEIPDFSGKETFPRKITSGGRSVVVDFIPGTSDKTVLILGGVHQDEKKGIELSKKLLKVLKSSKDKPFYNVVFIPNLFGERVIKTRDVETIDPNRNFPGKNESLEEAAKRGKGVPKDATGKRNILPENLILIALVEKVKPFCSLSIHSHSVVDEKRRQDINKDRQKNGKKPFRSVEELIGEIGAASITVDPRPGSEQMADFLTKEMAEEAVANGVPVPGNTFKGGGTIVTRYPTGTAPHEKVDGKEGVTFGQGWGSHRGGMNQYLIETDGKSWPGITPGKEEKEIDGWIRVIESKFLVVHPEHLVAEARELVRVLMRHPKALELAKILKLLLEPLVKQNPAR